MTLHQFGVWLHSTALSESVRSWPWLWPVCESLHFIGLSLLVGVIGLLDMRLLGFLPRIPIASLVAMRPYGLLGFGINLVTGVVFLVGAPEQYVNNIAWWWKMLFLAVSGLNAFYFETTHGHRVVELTPGEGTPTSFKLAGAVSIAAWFMVLYWGRMLPFVGNAF